MARSRKARLASTSVWRSVAGGAVRVGDAGGPIRGVGPVEGLLDELGRIVSGGAEEEGEQHRIHNVIKQVVWYRFDEFVGT